MRSPEGPGGAPKRGAAPRPGRRTLGDTGLEVPPVIFGTSFLGNLYEAHPHERKLAVVRNIVSESGLPAAFDSAGKYGAGLALESLARCLRELGLGADDVVLSNKLGWYRVPLRGAEPTFEPGVWIGVGHDAEQRISEEGIVECWEQGNELLAGYRADLVSVHDPDEYLAAAAGPADRARRLEDVVGAYRSLAALKREGKARAVGIGAKDWRVIRELSDRVELDWVMLACSFTVLSHPRELMDFIESLARRGVGIVNSALFHGGFLTGGDFFDYRRVDPAEAEGARLLAWRAKFFELCELFGITPFAAAVRFGLSAPGIVAIALNTGKPERVAENARSPAVEVPPAFWDAMRDASLLEREYPWV